MIQYGIYENREVKEKRKKIATPVKVERVPLAERMKAAEVCTMRIEKTVSLANSRIVTTSSFKKTDFTQSENSRKNLKTTGDFNGYMSDNTSRYVNRIISNWLTAIELNEENTKADYRNSVYVTFVTLTLPSKQVHHDNFLKEKCLNPMIKWLRDSLKTTKRDGGNVEAYLWRAESQKNGNLHFHLICDRWIDYDKIRKKWNQIIERVGYITMYRKTQEYIYRDGFRMRAEQAEKQAEALMYVVQSAIRDGKTIPDTKYRECPEVREMLNTVIREYYMLPKKEKKQSINYGLTKEVAEVLVYKMQVKAYEKGSENNWSDPNTTDIHKLQNLDSVAAYVCKYVSKKDVVTPKLEKNQRALAKENDNIKRIYTLTEGGSWDNLLDYYDENAPKYEITFNSRKVHGRIWGKSDNLSDGEETGKKIEPVKFLVETRELRGSMEFGWRIDSTPYNTEVIQYVEKIKEVIPEKEQTRLSDIINSDYCEVIPLGKYDHRINHKTKKKEKYFKNMKQIEFLKQYSPTIEKQYLSHYSKIFQLIYGGEHLQQTG